MDAVRTLTTGRGRLRRLLTAGSAALAVAGLLGPLGPASSGAAATESWSVQPSPVATAPQGQFGGVSCVSAAVCMAVGSTVALAGGQKALAERWDGTTWAVLSVPRPAGAESYSLSAVSCTSADACTAVGYARPGSGFDRPLAERWNGTTWAVQPTVQRDEGSYLLGVSCASASACTAVGYSRDVPDLLTLAERWNGTKWVIQKSANATSYDSLSAVSCPSVSDCTAVGSTNTGGPRTRSVAERWNGTTWALQHVPNPAGNSALTGVSCTSGTACTAVGHSGPQTSSTAVADRWNGTTWAVQSVPDPAGGNFLFGVSCASSRSCTAVGFGNDAKGYHPTGTLAERWNGTQWSVQATPRRGKTVQLSAVSCPSATACGAVGADSTKTGVTLAEAWNGTSWAIQHSPSPLGAESSGLAGISCVSAAACMAVGNASNHVNGIGDGTLAERWDGTRWAAEPTPHVPGSMTGDLAGSPLAAVSCTSASECTAVGYYRAPDSGTGYLDGLAERWNGTAWVVQPLPTSAEFSPLSGVSCTSATSCMAVGVFFNLKHSSPYKVLAEQWNGTTWTVETAPTPAEDVTMGGVSCTSASACTLVGSYESGDNQYTLAERWNGATWTRQQTPNAAGSAESWLSGVSCTSATSCMAVGYASGTKPRSVDVPLAERWDGKTWSILPAVNPSDAALTKLDGVSCSSATSCTAVGSWTGHTSQSIDPTLAEQWNGKTWAVQTTPDPGASTNELAAVSCQAGPCIAAGSYYTEINHPLVERRS
ncbi:MAG TPA: hypothetical protein VGM53_00740 [Streptosporangiaceae bacterium]|jgi:hypothetical protein